MRLELGKFYLDQKRRMWEVYQQGENDDLGRQIFKGRMWSSIDGKFTKEAFFNFRGVDVRGYYSKKASLAKKTYIFLKDPPLNEPQIEMIKNFKRRY